MCQIQDVENVEEKEQIAADTGNIFIFKSPPSIRLKCSICEGEFDKPAKSRREVCSFSCKTERSRRYSAEYQAEGRRMLAEFRRRFGGRQPTEAEIMDIIRKRKRT